MDETKDTTVIEVEKEKWTTLQFDSQILSAFMACPREMDYKYNQHLIPIGGPSKSMQKGTLVHEGMKSYYTGMQQGNYHDVNRLLAIDKIKEQSVTQERLESEDIADIFRAFEEYWEFRKNDVFNVVFVEQLFKKIIYEKFPLRIVLTGRIDLGISDASRINGITPWDHKSESESWFYSALNNQFKIYALACDSPTLVVNRFGFQKTVKPEKKFARETLNFEVDVLEEFKEEILPYYAKQMLIAMEDNYFPPNYTNCIKGHFSCNFSDKHSGGICNITRELRAEKVKRYFIEREWDPKNDA